MSTKTVQLIAVSVVFMAGIIGGVTLLQDREFTYVSLDEIVVDPTRWQGEIVAVQGTVQPASRQLGVRGDWRFNLVSRGQTLSVHYTGAVPNTFVDAAEVVVVGQVRNREVTARAISVRIPG